MNVHRLKRLIIATCLLTVWLTQCLGAFQILTLVRINMKITAESVLWPSESQKSRVRGFRAWLLASSSIRHFVFNCVRRIKIAAILLLHNKTHREAFNLLWFHYNNDQYECLLGLILLITLYWPVSSQLYTNDGHSQRLQK